jgi:uncharacterized protein DUF1905
MRFTGELWRHESVDGWHFVTLPPNATDELRTRAAGLHRPFGSLPVEARLGDVTWRTSVFSDAKRDAYLLPVKADVRRSAGVAAGDLLDVNLELLS